MVQEVFFFTEMAYSAYPQDVAAQRGYTALMLPNAYFDPSKAQELYHWYFEEYQYASEAGFDGVMINEHHNNPLNMMPSINVIGAILAKMTRRGRIIQLGNVLPIHDNPLRLAEEIAMLDVISGGRLTSGFVRGIGVESLAHNANPVYNRERFEEAHDLIVKTWTTPGPFRWEGKHYHYRVVNPWMLPLQKPHPPIWVPGIASPETIMWAARHRYPYLALNTSLEVTPRIWKLYAETAAEEGYQATPEHYGYMIRICVADSDAEAYELGRNFYWQLGRTFGRVPLHWQRPPGYMSRTAMSSQQTALRDAYGDIGYEQAQEVQQVITGTPDTVIAKLQKVIDVVNPAWLVLWAREGLMSHAAAMRCLELLGKEVIPAIKAYQPKIEGEKSP